MEIDMRINVNQVLRNFEGQVMKDQNAQGEAIDATLKLSLVNALLAPGKQDAGVEKIQKYELAKKIYRGGEVELSTEEVTLCKSAVNETFPHPMVVGQINNMLEGKQK
jgi:hypothetical protein